MRTEGQGKSLLLALGAALVLAIGLAACNDKPWRTKNIAGLMPALEFDLTDQNGRRVTAADYRGKVVLLFFGYSHCPDVCPTTLAKLAGATSRVSPSDDVRILFVSVDPARDTLQVLRAYTGAFGKGIVGLRGTREALDQLTKRYRVTYGYGEPDASGNYPVSHSSAVFVFDEQGDARLLVRDSDPVDAIVADLDRLIAES